MIMSMVINTNMASLNAVRILEQSSREQSTAMERLTSGLRINRAADDAAGLAVTESMNTQVRGTEVAIRNANDGIGLIQTMDGAMDEVMGMLQRMRELGIQSLNGTYSAANRAQMDAEFTQLQNEIERVADTTKFNGTALLDGTNTSVDLHVGWETNAADKLNIVLSDFTTSNLNTSTAQNITSTTAASDAIANLNSDISAINLTRAKWGALQNRLESTVANLQNVNENISAARSRIVDADFAKESAELARTQVLQQAGMSMLSQANQQSQNVLQLLQG
jgi:flagellin